MAVTRNVWIKYHSPAGDGGDGGSGGPGAGGDSAGGSGGSSSDDKDGDGDDGGKPDDKGGKKGPTDEEARLLKENMKRKEELRKTQEELTTLKDSIKDLDLDAVRKLLAEQKTAEEKALEAKGDYDRLKQRMAEEHGKEVTTMKAKIAELEGSVGKANGIINDLTVGTQFGQSQFVASELTLTPTKARVIYGDHFDIEDGKVVGYDKPRGAASRTALVDQYGNAVGFDAALRKIVEADPEKDRMLKSKVKPGAGSDSRKASGDPAKDAPGDSMSKIAAGLKGLKIA
ncbi:MAG: hypothetical protein FWF12_00440 [Betaproteobacteria bacterium]|nr:hypothetical protein [Betaproteobacteria bacterium]